MRERFRFILQHFAEQLWIKPLLVCLISIAGVFLAKAADTTDLGPYLPDIQHDSIYTLLSTISSSMLVIATFAIGSMVTSYASASSKATPRSFTLVVADDDSQNALSTFIGSFIYSIVGLISLENGYFDRAGRFALFVLTLVVFTLVILTFVRWLDRIARLGRIQTTIDTVEEDARCALLRRKKAPRLQGVATSLPKGHLTPVFSTKVGYLQCIEMGVLQEYASKEDLCVRIASLPGTFCTPDRPLAFFWQKEVKAESSQLESLNQEIINTAFVIDNNRTFTDDPRFGLIVLSEIASKAMSPAVNDSGTAITVIGSSVRLLTEWFSLAEKENQLPVKYDRIEVPELSPEDMLDDAFMAIARDGAGTVEVAIRLQKALYSLSVVGDKRLQEATQEHIRMALARVDIALDLQEDRDAVHNSVLNSQKAFH
mgnify:CR=1 FL=1|tara:strand:+ start:4558 stop:5841 length:1284 start_codon:yes stop_codon:yes gene_type:complete